MLATAYPRYADITDIFFIFRFFRRDALKEQFGKEPNTVRCLAVKSTLLGTRHPRKEKEASAHLQKKYLHETLGISKLLGASFESHCREDELPLH